jgi:hypothetical protein
MQSYVRNKRQGFNEDKSGFANTILFLEST